MESVIFISIFNIIILSFVFLNKKNESLIYDVTPEEQYADNLNEFDKNIKAIEIIDVSNYKLGLGHLYE